MQDDSTVEIEEPLSREKAQALAFDWADDPSTVAEIVHEGFNSDAVSGGYAFMCDRGLAVYGFDGGQMQAMDPGDDTRRRAELEQYWRRVQHRHRQLGLDDVTEWHRAAIAALTGGCQSVADLPPQMRPGVTDTAAADTLLIRLRRRAEAPTTEAALRAVAADDWLLEVPDDHSRAHPCPVCGRPAIGRAWKYTSVCDSCYRKATCSHGQVVTGYNTHIFGGFEARHADDQGVCAQVTDDGRVTVDGHECHMGEAKFGGVFVGAVPKGSPA